MDITSTQVSRAAKLLDDELETWRNRPIDQIEDLIIDARYEKVCVACSVRDCAVFGIPSEHRKRMRTTNMLERQNRELKRRTRVASLFPNEASLLRLVTAVLVELSDEWETGMRYLTFQD